MNIPIVLSRAPHIAITRASCRNEDSYPPTLCSIDCNPNKRKECNTKVKFMSSDFRIFNYTFGSVSFTNSLRSFRSLETTSISLLVYATHSCTIPSSIPLLLTTTLNHPYLYNNIPSATLSHAISHTFAHPYLHIYPYATQNRIS